MCHETRCSSHAGQHVPRFFLSKNNRYFLGSAGSDDVVDPRQLFFKHVLVEEQERRKRLILRGGCNVHLCCQVAQKSHHFIGTHFLWGPNTMKCNALSSPRRSLQCADCSGSCALFRGPGRAILALLARCVGPSGVWHLAAFLAGLPSKRQEIDDKLQSNSR
jgi:hypothetical protein